MRYSGKVGYFTTVETQPGYFEEKYVTRPYQGDIIRNYKRNQSNSIVNDNIFLNNQLSIVADPYAREHFFQIKCAWWQGTWWEVTSVEVQPPRLILELGGPYNEDVE